MLKTNPWTQKVKYLNGENVIGIVTKVDNLGVGKLKTFSVKEKINDVGDNEIAKIQNSTY